MSTTSKPAKGNQCIELPTRPPLQLTSTSFVLASDIHGSCWNRVTGSPILLRRNLVLRQFVTCPQDGLWRARRRSSRGDRHAGGRGALQGVAHRALSQSPTCGRETTASGPAEGVQRRCRAHVHAAVSDRGCRVGVLVELVHDHRRDVAARRHDDDRARLGGEEDVSVGGDG